MSLRSGKLPPAMLAELLARIPHRDPRVLAGPGIGRDAAVIDLGGRLLVAKTDPVTFATDQIGWYAVNVNANDVACMGARPTWFMATALLPTGSPASLASDIFDQIIAACEALDIELVGGHTEVTPGIDRPIIAGAMLGPAAPDEIVAGENIIAGDAVLLTKGIAIEGTALLARDAQTTLARLGVPGATIEVARQMLFAPGISVVRDAVTICSNTRPRLMHDPTEGGISTALHEMAQAAAAPIAVDVGAIRVFDETRAVCRALGLDAMGLLASGALLAIVAAEDAERVKQALHSEGIACEQIGRVGSGQPGVILDSGLQATPHPAFPRDEIARFYDELEEGL
jgi:hydrogenase maturation factor